jgi:3-oxoacyl-[acyl-carrier-protein] synthase II
MWEVICQGKCGIAPITRFETEGNKVTLAAELKNFDPSSVLEPAQIRKMDMYTVYAILAATEAFSDAGIFMEKEDAYRCGVIFSSGIGGLETFQKECERGAGKGFERVSPYFIPLTIVNMAAGNIAIRFGMKGICTCPVTACASSTNALGDAFRQIRDGYQDMILCGGSEASITPLGIGGFASMKALSTSKNPMRASIPFDKERNGFVMGEGAGALVLEEYEHAKQRGAKIYCEVSGYGTTCDANHITAPLADGSAAAKCMSLAMTDAGIGPEDIIYINAHGTSTGLNDKSETLAIRKAFGDHAKKVAVSSTKSMTGHLLGASGAIEAVITALSVKEDVIPPTVNYRVPDEECDLNLVVNQMQKKTIGYAMSNSLGFGGHNASVIFKKFMGGL